VREATPDDLSDIYRLFLSAYSLSAYAAFPVDEISVKRTIGQILLGGFAHVTENVDGAILGLIRPALFNPSIKAAATPFFFVQDSARGQGIRLLRAYIKWAEQRAQIVTLSISYGNAEQVKRTERLYERMGFIRAGTEFIKIGDQHV